MMKKKKRISLLVLFLMMVISMVSFAADQEKIVFDFESGDLAKENWIIVEGENTRPIGSRDQIFHTKGLYPKKGKYYLTLLEDAADQRTHEANTCVIESPVFRPSAPEFHFLLGGGNIPATWLSLCQVQESGEIKEIRQFRGQNRQTMDPFTLDLTPWLNKPLLFRFIDQGTGAWSYLHADDFHGLGIIDLKYTELRRDFIKRGLLHRQLDGITDSLKQARQRLAEFDTASELDKRTEALIAECERMRNDESVSVSNRIKKCHSEIEKRAATIIQDVFRTDPALNASPILYVSRPQYPYEHHNTETTFQTDDICTHRLPETGSTLKVWNPKDGKVNVLLEVPQGIVRDPCISFDGKRIMISLRWNIEDDFHIYEMDLSHRDPLSQSFKREDLRQLTFGSGLSDIDPQYLPDGRIVFSSTREPKYCMCNRHIMVNLHVMNDDGSNILQIGHSTLYEGHSSLLPDGRILYYRWEYVDRNFSDAEGIWTVNPDGTNHAIFWGNNTESPAAVIDPRVMPGSSSEFVCTMCACHTSPRGAIGLIDRRLGLDGKKPVVQVWPQEAWPLIGTSTGTSYDNLMRLRRFFEDPWPLDEDHIIASGSIPEETVLPGQNVTRGKIGVTGIWLLTMDGGMHLWHTDPVGCFDPMPLKASEKPPVITDRTDLSKETGSFYVTNVNEGFGMEKVPQGTAKYLRIIESPEKRFWTHPSWVGVDGKGNQQAPAMNWNEFGNKRIIGVVPVEKDGSVYFTVPADKFVFFQLLDENRQMIQSMRSGVIVRPGETNGCYGCHEDRLETPVSTKVTLAMRNKPRVPTPEFGRAPFFFSYTETVQPILDKHCIACHDRPTEKSSPLAKQAAKKVLLCGDRDLVFNCSYWELHDKKLINAIGSAYAEKIKPLVWGARKSRLIEIMRFGHDKGGPIDQAAIKLGLRPIGQGEIDLTAAWIDMNAPYYPVYSSNFPDNPYGRSPLTFSEMDELAKLTGRNLVKMEMASGKRPVPILDHDVSFDRPEMSPCLDRWKDAPSKESKEYQRALTLIKTGQERLNATPRADMPGWKIVNPIELRRQAKYDVFLKRSQNMKDAVLQGRKLLDRDNQLPFDKCFQ